MSHVSHDLVKPYLERERLTPSDVGLQVKSDLMVSEEGFVVFDDTIPDKKAIHAILNPFAGSIAVMPMVLFEGLACLTPFM